MTKMIVALIGFVLLLTGCATAPKEPVDIQGEWIASVSDTDISFESEIKNGVIKIDLVMGESTGLYWIGEFPNELTNGDTFVGSGDMDQLELSLYGSLTDTKEFEFKNGNILFEFIIMGLSYDIEMEKIS